MNNQIGVSIFEKLKIQSDKTGFVYKDNKTDEWIGINWGEVESRIMQIAYALLNHGVKHQDKVAIFAQNSIEWMLTDIAIMSIGGVSVPIYATNTTKQAAYVINDAKIDLVFSGDIEQFQKSLEIVNNKQSKLKNIITFNNELEITDHVTQHLSSFIDIEHSNKLINEFKKRFSNVTLTDLATLIYTSGTTGEPKGVMLTHANFVSTFKIHDKYLSTLTDKDHSLCFLPLSHVFERTWTLYCMHRGLKVSFLSNPKLIIETLKTIKPTLFCTVPRVYEKVYNEIQNKLETASKTKKAIFKWSVEQGGIYQNFLNQKKTVPLITKLKKTIANKLVLNKIKAILGSNIKMSPTAGAPLSKEIQSFMIATGIPVTMGYGLTETTASVTAFPVNNYKIGSVGKVLEGIKIKIGEKDEILVKAPTVMKGYYNKEKTTSDVFDGEWFKTGDAGRIENDGSLFITDRIKDLMKTSSGKYIVPQQTEVLLTNDNFIEQAIIIADEKPYVTALIVPNFEALKKYASLSFIEYTKIEDLLVNSKIKEFYEAKINLLQKELANFEQIKKIKLLPREFTMEEGELTPTLKTRRKIIIAKFENLILELYRTPDRKFVI